MIREVDLVSYLPEFMQLYKEPIEILKAENPEFQIIWKVADKAFYNRFISTADDYGISRFENILGIYPNATDTLENRRMRLQSRWFNKIPYTIRNLAEKINNILGGEYNFAIQADFKNAYELYLTVYTINDSQNEELEYILSIVVPVNIVTNIIYEEAIEGAIYYGGMMYESDIIEIKQRQV